MKNVGVKCKRQNVKNPYRATQAKNENDCVDFRVFQKQQHPGFSAVLLVGKGFAPKMQEMKMIIVVVDDRCRRVNCYYFSWFHVCHLLEIVPI